MLEGRAVREEDDVRTSLILIEMQLSCIALNKNHVQKSKDEQNPGVTVLIPADNREENEKLLSQIKEIVNIIHLLYC